MRNIILVFICLLSFSSYGQDKNVEAINAKQFRRLMFFDKNTVVIDVRSDKNKIEKIIKGAYIAQKSEVLYQLVDSLGKNKTYMLYCKYGERSYKAAEMLNKKYSCKCYSLEDGLKGWKKAGFKLTNIKKN
ncbi:MAG: rhodanese-like domain-containing protein [Marinifilaceae bacterium]|nr:rhodanese-like domain-containing protein [Marinifilaceae bacterium]